jgi:putative hydrolase of the HAD superfamily
MRKPDTEIYTYVLQESRLDPRETLFIDDFIENIETASQLGIQTIHLKYPLTLLNLFNPITV